MPEIFNCWQCHHYDHMSALCRKHSTSCAAIDPICEDFCEIHKPERQLAKLFMNNLYGKFGTNPMVKTKEPYWEAAQARNITIRTSQKIHMDSKLKTGHSRYYYSDTDSIHLLGLELPEGINIHPRNLANETAENDGETLFVFPVSECYHTREDADNA